MLARHLPPSAGRPRVLALDEATAAELAAVAEVVTAAADAAPVDAVAGYRLATPEALAGYAARLRPGGRLILAAAAEPAALLGALQAAGLIHCLVETAGDLTLYRGERPPTEASPLARAQHLAATAPAEAGQPRFLYLLVTQTPNKPAWKLEPGERVAWRAATVEPAPDEPPRLLAFSSLVKAVAYLQPAVLAGAISGVNKVAKFPAAAAQRWPLGYVLNPTFEALRAAAAGPAVEVSPEAAVTGEE